MRQHSPVRNPPVSTSTSDAPATTATFPAPMFAPASLLQPTPAATRPVECEWVRLRAGTRVIVTRAHDPGTGQDVEIRLHEGVRYNMPPGCEFGRHGKPHPMVVREVRQPGYACLDLADLAVQRWDDARRSNRPVVEQARTVVERERGKGAVAELERRGAADLLEVANAILTAQDRPTLALFPVELPLPAGVQPIAPTERIIDLDRRACGHCGEQTANDDGASLRRHLAQFCPVRAATQMSEADRQAITRQVTQAIRAGL